MKRKRTGHQIVRDVLTKKFDDSSTTESTKQLIEHVLESDKRVKSLMVLLAVLMKEADLQVVIQ